MLRTTAAAVALGTSTFVHPMPAGAAGGRSAHATVMHADAYPHVAVAVAGTGDGGGFWTAFADGTVTTNGDAQFYGDMAGKPMNRAVVGIAATPDGRGYWLLGADGGVFSFGDAGFYGSTGSMHLNAPALGMAATADGRGYWFVAADGGVFTFGDGRFFGSTGSMRLNRPVVGMAVTPDGGGYWLDASDGGVFTFGDAGFYGSTGSMGVHDVVGMARTTDGRGYWLAAGNGAVYAFGDAPQYPAAQPGTVGIVAAAAGGYWTVNAAGNVQSFGPVAGATNPGSTSPLSASPAGTAGPPPPAVQSNQAGSAPTDPGSTGSTSSGSSGTGTSGSTGSGTTGTTPHGGNTTPGGGGGTTTPPSTTPPTSTPPAATPPTVSAASIGFAKAAVWQTDDIVHSAGGFNVADSNVIAAVTRDATDMQNAGVTWARWWVGPGDSVAQETAVATIFRQHGISLDFDVNSGSTSDPATEQGLKNWLSTMVPAMARLGDHYWEIGNEPNLDRRAGGYWTDCAPGVSPSGATGQGDASAAVASYVVRLEDAYTTIHQLDPNAFVSSAGLSYDPSYNAYCEIPSDQWIQALEKTPAANYMDCFGIHPYSGSPSGVVAALADTRRALDASASYAGIPFCITEVGMWASGYNGSQNGYIGTNSETARAADYVTMMKDLASDGITTPVFWYTWYDYSQPSGYGIVHYSGLTSRSYLPIYYAMQGYQP